MMSPDKTLQSRSLRRCPLHSNKMTDVLQAVRSHGKVDFAVNVAIHIDQTLEHALCVGLVPFCQGGDRSEFITAVMIDWGVRILRNLLHELLPHGLLIMVRIRPKCRMFRRVFLTHRHPNQIIPLPIGYPFHVHKQFNGMSWDVRQLLEIDLVLTYRQGLQLDFMRAWG